LVKELGVVVECNGKQHYINGQLKFQSSLKCAILRKRGFRVLQIHVDDWNQIVERDRPEYLNHRLTDAKVQREG